MSPIERCAMCGGPVEGAPVDDPHVWNPGPAERVSPDDPLINGARWRRERDEAREQLRGAVAENERLRHEVQARDDVIYHAAEHLRHALDVIAAYEDRITTSGGQ